MAKKPPFNLEILQVDKRKLQGVPEIKVLDITDGATDNLHPEGLFSTEYFGRKGEDRRTEQFAYIDMKTRILHPIIYDAYSKLKGLYKGILEGTDYAVWNSKEKDFERSNELTGDTGYSFFIKHMDDIKFKRTGSAERDDHIQLIDRNRDRALTRFLLVLPAGLRDIEEDGSGRVKKDEINKKYARVLGVANLIGADGESSAQDATRKTLQNTVNDIYAYIKNLLDGKNGFMLSKWASRSIFNGTRNVIASKNTVRESLDSDNVSTTTHTGIGLFQLMKGTLPITKYALRQFMSSRFSTQEGNVIVVNKKTWRPESVTLSTDDIDQWTTSEGVEKTISRFKDPALRHRPVMLGDGYAFLVYQDDKGFRVFDDIEQLPDNFSRDNVRPISLAEVCYLCQYEKWYSFGGYVTRFPVTGTESTYPTKFYAHTTSKSKRLLEYDAQWELQQDKVAREFPVPGSSFMDALIPDTTRLAGLGADFDGDTCSADIVYTKNGLKEIDDLLNDMNTHIDPRGGFRASTSTDTIELVINNLTGDPL